MTINWYHKILLVLAAFIAMMTYFAVRSVNAPLELVTEKYYEAEIKYQDRINDITNANNLLIKPRITAHQGKLHVQFPPKSNRITGTLNLYYAANSLYDKSFPIHVNASNQFDVDIQHRSGAYRIQLDWEENGTHYFTEEKLFL
jgi:hypothetical protein